MELWQIGIIGTYGIIAFIGFLKSFYECYKKKNPFGLTYINRIYSAFVWADMVIFGLFWTIVSFITLLLQDWLLFLLAFSLFWLTRSIGETIYWFLQQFSTINRNPIRNFPYFKKVFHNDSIWFVHQIIWQCMTVFFLITSLYIAKLWLQ